MTAQRDTATTKWPDEARVLGALHQVALSLAAPTDLSGAGGLLVRIARSAAQAFGSRSGSLVLPNDDWLPVGPDPSREDAVDGCLFIRARGTIRRARIPTRGANWHVLTTGEPLFVHDTTAESPYGPFRRRLSYGLRAFASVPL